MDNFINRTTFLTKEEIFNLEKRDLLECKINYNYNTLQIDRDNMKNYDFPYHLEISRFLMKYPYFDFSHPNFYNSFIIQYKKYSDFSKYFVIDMRIDALEFFEKIPYVLELFLEILEKNNIGYLYTLFTPDDLVYSRRFNTIRIQLVTYANSLIYDLYFKTILQKHWDELIKKDNYFAKLYFKYLMEK